MMKLMSLTVHTFHIHSSCCRHRRNHFHSSKLSQHRRRHRAVPVHTLCLSPSTQTTHITRPLQLVLVA